MNRETTDLCSPFDLHPALAGETLASFDLPLCQVILRDEGRWPWIVLVPRRAGAEEVFDLLPGDRATMWSEVEQVAAALKSVTAAQKINIAQFGNVCRQLHIHIVARSEADPMWPGGVIGVGARESYASSDVPDWWVALRARRDLTNP